MLTKLSVKKPYTIIVAILIIAVFGIVALFQIKSDLLPDIDYPYVVITTAVEDSGPEEIESMVTIPIEKAVSGVAKVIDVSSVSSEDKSIVTVEFDQSADMDSVVAEVRESLETLSSSWDASVSVPVIKKINPDATPVFVVSVSMDDQSGVGLSNFMNDCLSTYFNSIDGIADVELQGIVSEDIQITINSDKINEINTKIFQAIGGDYEKARAALEATDSALDTVTSDLLSQTAAIDAQIRTLNTQLAEAQAADNTRTTNINNYKTKLEELNTSKTKLETEIAATDATDSAYTSLLNQLTQIETEIANVQANLTNAQNESTNETLISSIKSQISGLESQRSSLTAQMSASEATVAESKAEITEQLSALDQEEEAAKNAANLTSLITTDMVASMLEAQNFSSTAGSLDLGNKKYDVTVGDKITSVSELQNLILFHFDLEGVGNIVLSQVADISVVNNGAEVYSKINGNDGLLVSFYKQSDYSVAEAVDNIKATIAKVESVYPSAVITVLSDQSVYIDRVSSAVGENLVIGAVLAVLILFFFLRDLRPTAVVACSIPVSILCAIALMYFTGVTLNIFSLSGLALGVGMLVDNSIVVMENIYRCRSLGLSRRDAAIEGAKQVTPAIIASTLTTVCVFMPILFMDGISRQLFMDIGLTITYALLASLLIAFTLVPSMSSGVLRKMKMNRKNPVKSLLKGYQLALSWVLTHRVFVVLFGLMLTVFTGIFSFSQGTSFLPQSDSLEMTISVSMKEETTKEILWDTTDRIAELLLAMDDVENVGAVADTGGVISLSGVSEGNGTILYVTLKEDKEKTCAEVADDIQKQAENLGCYLNTTVGSYDFSSLYDEGIHITVSGNDTATLAAITDDMGELLLSVEGTEQVKSSMDTATPTLKIAVNKEAAMAYGLTVADVYDFIANAISSSANATTLQSDSNNMDVIVIDGDSSGLTLADIQNLVMNVEKDDGTSAQVVLSSVATISEEEGVPIIYRDNQMRYMTASAGVADDYNIGNVSNEVQELVDGYSVPEGYSVTVSGERLVITEAMKDLILALALAVLLMYLIMVAQFQSLLLPLIIMITVPLAFTGGFVGLLVTGMDVSVIALVGFLLLSGIVVNNGIVLVDYINRLRRSGISLTRSVVEGGCTRMRPILMTASTTILAVLTLAFGLGMGAEIVQPMAIVVLGGMIYATLVTLFVVPALYDLALRRDKVKFRPVTVAEEPISGQTSEDDQGSFFKRLLNHFHKEDDLIAVGLSDDLKDAGVPESSDYFIFADSDEDDDIDFDNMSDDIFEKTLDSLNRENRKNKDKEAEPVNKKSRHSLSSLKGILGVKLPGHAGKYKPDKNKTQDDTFLSSSDNTHGKGISFIHRIADEIQEEKTDRQEEDLTIESIIAEDDYYGLKDRKRKSEDN